MLHLGPCSSVGMRPGTDRQTDRHTDTQTAVANIHFASAMPHAKRNQYYENYDNLLSLENCEFFIDKLEMWANAQRDGRPAEHRWRPVFNAAKFG